MQSEELLHYIWQQQLFKKQRKLSTSSGLPIQVVHPGVYNRDAGPDFRHALLRIDGLLWAGSVEMHLQEADWCRHGHDHDPAYNNVVLHVVWREQSFQAPNRPPFLLCIDKLAKMPRHKPRHPMKPEAPACTAAMPSWPAEHWQDLLAQRAAQRLDEKSRQMVSLLQLNKNDWHETSWQALAAGMGMLKNREPMLELARRLPFKAVRKLANQPQMVLAAALGTAGLLEKVFPNDPEWEKRYQMAKALMGLGAPLEPGQWLYARMRPPSFPHRRIMQWVALGLACPTLPVLVTGCSSTAQLKELFVKGNGLLPEAGLPGPDLLEHVLINFLFPLRYYYQQSKKGPVTVADEMAALPAEDNQITRLFAGGGLKPASALGSQGLLELYKNHCQPGLCAVCPAGHLVPGAVQATALPEVD